ncbi:unnamed protein product [Litomosoides sigmodontis]|uniref:Uncharacterized protein n=1 Tax=Litomosoides sigmodontis TaxID=42156 RepID=A0A3P6SK00_LITSI|nr:unnamed protein product [Litomosoides sigmodontis]
MEQIGNRTPDKSKCSNPGPPPHQPTFTSAPYCSRQCACQKRKKNNEIHEKIKNWLINRDMMEKQKFGGDSGIFSPDDESDKENRP